MLPELKKIFGDQVQLDQRSGKVRWQGSIIKDLVSDVVAGKKTKEWIDLGGPTKQAVEKSKAHMDITGYRMDIRADDVRHILGKHGEGKEKHPDQRPVTSLDFEMAPHVWRNPDAIKPGNKDRSLEFSKEINGKLVTVQYQKDPKQRVFWLNTMWVKK
jgi:hypothetical protein